MSEREEKPQLEEAEAGHDGGAPGSPGVGDPGDAGLGGGPLHTPGEHDVGGEIDPEMQAVLDEVDVRDMLRSALAPPPGAVAPSLLHGVQRKLRRRSRGKFYGDGWSTARAPRSTYLLTSLVMLVLIAFVFLVLIPWGSGALP
jgi:hypothetical protein